MVSSRGMLIGTLLIIGGFIAIFTFVSPTFLFSIGVDVNTYRVIEQQFRIWGVTIGIFLVIGGLIAMGKFE